ncbi:hypothetical protein ABZT04_31065 [Streptomyces sp. NPDC005492]|uniref:hypothetical protein n=1 Tax=Streptomyces sp. NPDC005492 TaxID=3156883 RepID=UPI0033BF5190
MANKDLLRLDGAGLHGDETSLFPAATAPAGGDARCSRSRRCGRTTLLLVQER